MTGGGCLGLPLPGLSDPCRKDPVSDGDEGLTCPQFGPVLCAAPGEPMDDIAYKERESYAQGKIRVFHGEGGGCDASALRALQRRDHRLAMLSHRDRRPPLSADRKGETGRS